MKKIGQLVLFFSIALLLSFSTSAVENDSTIEKQIFYEAATSDYFYVYKLDISHFVAQVESFYENEEMPEAVDNYLNVTLINLVNKYNDDMAELEDKTKFDVMDYKAALIATQNYFFSSYNEFVPIYNEYLKEKVGNDSSTISNLIGNLYYNVYATPYYFINWYENTYLYSEKNYMSALYDRVYEDLSEVIDDETELKEKTFEIMKKSILTWLEELDIDYLNAYQGQVNQYVDTLNEMGYFIGEDEYGNEYVTLDTSKPKIRDITLKEFLNPNIYTPFHVNPDFHALTLNEDKTAFLTPEQIFESGYFQVLVENVLEPLSNLSEYDKETVLDAMQQTILNQYYAIGYPGSYQQPTQGLIYAIAPFASDINEIDKDLPLLTSWILPETNEAPYETYRPLNYLKVPYVNLSESVTKDVTRTVKYEFEDGTKAANSVVQKVTFKGNKNLINGLATWEDDELTFKALTNPKVSHSNKRVVVLKSKDKVSEKKVNPDSKNSTITVVYPIEIKAKVNYVDKNGKKLHESKTIQGRYNKEYKVKPIDIKGYKIYNSPKNATGLHKVGMKDITFVYQKDDTPTDLDDKDLPGTGSDITKAFGLLLIALLIGIGVYFKKKL